MKFNEKNKFMRAAWFSGLALGLTLLTIALIFLIGAHLKPNNAGLQFITLVLPTILPYLIILSVTFVIIGGTALKFGPKRFSSIILIVSLITGIMSTGMTLKFVNVVKDAGGSINFVSALSPSAINGAKPDLSEIYKTVDGQNLTVSIHKPKLNNGAAPVMIYIHGGGWNSNDADSTSSVFRWYADQGWLVLSVNYRLATPDYATWDKALPDVADALSWASKNASRLGGDIDNMVIAGESAGGNLALVLGYSAASGQLKSDYGIEVPIPKGIWVSYPATDLNNLYTEGEALILQGSVPLNQYIGGSPDEYPERYKAVNPSTYLSSKAPPTLIIQGEKDSLTQPSGNISFADEARNAGVDVKLVLIPYSNHGFDLMSNAIGEQGTRTIVQNYFEGLGVLQP